MFKKIRKILGYSPLKGEIFDTKDIQIKRINTYSARVIESIISDMAKRIQELEYIQEQLIKSVSAPIMKINGGNIQRIEKGTTYEDLGVEVFNDNGNVEVIATGTVDTDTINNYEVTYTATNTSTQETTDTKKTVIVTDYAPVISYIDSNNIWRAITDNQVFLADTKVRVNRGIAEHWKDGEYLGIFTNDTILTEGTYKIIASADDGTSSEKTFIVDTKAPVVNGVKRNGSYTEPVTITFEDVSDLSESLLKRNDGTEVNLVEWFNEHGGNSYTVSEEGIYVLTATDIHGNSMTSIKFRITLS